MAQLLLINDKTYRENVNEIGDVVGVFEDTHEFSDTEKNKFEIMPIEGVTRKEVVEKLDGNFPETSPVWKAEVTEWSFNRPEEKYIWKDNKGEWCWLEETHKYPFTCADMGTDIKILLASIQTDKVSKMVLIDGNIKETISRQEVNLNKVVDDLYKDGEIIVN